MKKDQKKRTQLELWGGRGLRIEGIAACCAMGGGGRERGKRWHFPVSLDLSRRQPYGIPSSFFLQKHAACLFLLPETKPWTDQERERLFFFFFQLEAGERNSTVRKWL